jgi:hypothetical protein
MKSLQGFQITPDYLYAVYRFMQPKGVSLRAYDLNNKNNPLSSGRENS